MIKVPKTASEERFEEFCSVRAYRYSKIDLPGSAGRRPDYRVITPSGEIICEVKQLEPNDWDIRITSQLERHGTTDASRSIGDRARKLIKNAAQQLKRHENEGIPCVIVAMNLTWDDHLSDIDIDAGMFGSPVVRFYPSTEINQEMEGEFGHKDGKQMTEKIHRYVSAICVLERRNLRLKIYHNPFAISPLLPGYFPDPADTHLIKDRHPQNSGQLWLEYTGPRPAVSKAPI